MEQYINLLGKNAIATTKLARELLRYPLGEKIPTVSEFTDALSLARGTVQNGIKTLVESGAIRLESKGHLGSYLIKKNVKTLLKYAGINSLLGAMPLPYSKRYEGLASGIIATMENNYELPVNLAYMRGSKNRISMVIQKRYDFAIVSLLSAKRFIEEYGDIIKIVMDFGERSYLNRHVMMFHDDSEDDIKDGMKVGIDLTSVDQSALVNYVCKDKDVELVQLEYSQILNKIIYGDIDASVMNEDEALDKRVRIKMVPIDGIDDGSIAAVITRSDNEIIDYLIRELLDVTTVLNIQKLVLEGKITPSY